MRIIYIALTLLVFLALTACTTSSSHNRGSLSGAMDKARDDYEGEREVPDEEDPWWENDEEDSRWGDNSDRDDSYGEDYTAAPIGDVPATFLIRTGSTLGSGPYFSSQERYELLLGWEENNMALDFFGGLVLLDTNTAHLVSESITDGAFILEAGAEFRYYPWESLQFFSPYAGGRFGGLFMMWTFRNALTSGDDTITSDAVGGAVMGAVAGVDIIRTESLRLGVQINPEAYLFSAETSEGFDNDVFGAQGSINWSIEGGFRF
ncbi:MAG: hypothetical protein JXA95_18985 [Spirochaetales bacterium]|nr:hypothetical protein [Spirochaetales bacterium]